MKQRTGSLKRQTKSINSWQIWLKCREKRPKLIKLETKKGR
jgi:hypothetical protein